VTCTKGVGGSWFLEDESEGQHERRRVLDPNLLKDIDVMLALIDQRDVPYQIQAHLLISSFI